MPASSPPDIAGLFGPSSHHPGESPSTGICQGSSFDGKRLPFFVSKWPSTESARKIALSILVSRSRCDSCPPERTAHFAVRMARIRSGVETQLQAVYDCSGRERFKCLVDRWIAVLTSSHNGRRVVAHPECGPPGRGIHTASPHRTSPDLREEPWDAGIPSAP